MLDVLAAAVVGYGLSGIEVDCSIDVDGDAVIWWWQVYSLDPRGGSCLGEGETLEEAGASWLLEMDGHMSRS